MAGGPQIDEMLQRLSIKSSFVDGLRVTDEAMVEVVEMVLAGSVNKTGGKPDQSRGAPWRWGLSGKDGGLIRARKLRRREATSGQAASSACSISASWASPSGSTPRVLHALTGSGLIPVIAPIGYGAGRLHLQHQRRHGGRRHRGARWERPGC